MRLEGKVVLITGGGSGIGLATAKLFRHEGAEIAIAGRRADVLQNAAREVGGALACACDVSDESAVRDLVARVVERYGRIDVLVHSAGINPNRTDLIETDLDTFRGTMEASASGAFLTSREVVKVMSPGGAIVLIGSIVAIRGSATSFSISAAKGALHAVTRQMAKTLGSKGIRVNLVAPGLTHTDLTADRLDTMSRDVYEGLLAGYPWGVLGDPQDIAYACLYLASNEAKWVTGVILPVDGGYSS